MQLDWFTVGAQIVNFLVLVALLKRFLYRPIIVAMDTREAHIAARLQEAEVKTQEADRQAARHSSQLAELQENQDTLLAQATANAETQRQRLLAQARQEVQQLQERWQAALRQDHDAFLHALRQQAGTQVCMVARRALRELAQADLEQQVIEVFLTRLQGLDEAARQPLIEAARMTTQGLVVRSAFALSEAVSARMRHDIREHLGLDAEVVFATAPDLLCGIELEVHGSQKVAWNLTDYLDHFEDHLAALLAEETGRRDGGTA